MRPLEHQMMLLTIARTQGRDVAEKIRGTQIALANGAYFRGVIGRHEFARRVAAILDRRKLHG